MPAFPTTMSSQRFASLAALVITGACASTPESTAFVPRTVYIPAGWLGTTKTKATTAKNDTLATAKPTTPAVDEAPAIVELSATFPDLPRTALLPKDDGKTWFNPLPKGVFSGYNGDTGLDIASPPHAVYAIAAGTFDYSEEGHTRWTGKTDTPNSIRIALDVPMAWKGHRITHLYYTHLSALSVVQPEGSKPRHHVQAGEQIGISGQANGMPHLHLGMLLDDHVEQDEWGTFLLEGEIRVVLGGYKNGDTLPALANP